MVVSNSLTINTLSKLLWGHKSCKHIECPQVTCMFHIITSTLKTKQNRKKQN